MHVKMQANLFVGYDVIFDKFVSLEANITHSLHNSKVLIQVRAVLKCISSTEIPLTCIDSCSRRSLCRDHLNICIYAYQYTEEIGIILTQFVWSHSRPAIMHEKARKLASETCDGSGMARKSINYWWLLNLLVGSNL